MPRVLNPGSIATGGGLAAPKTVEATSFVHPTQGLDGLIAHIVDPSRAHMARAVGIEDAGGYYSSDHVEGALQEIGGGFSSGTQNGVISGCTFTAAGLNVTMAASSLVRIGTERDISGEVEALNDNATNWLYVDTSGNLTHSTGASPPSISSPENVLLWRIVTNAGAVTASTDARFFIPNLDRKLQYTVRSSGTATNRNAEACFVTLDAAMLYLEKFSIGGTSTKTVLIIRGSHTISATVTLPAGLSNITFQGEDGAQITTGAVLSPVFNLNQCDYVTFRDIEFRCNNAGSVAISETTGGNSNLTVERCSFQSGGADWDRAINVQGAAGVARTIIRQCLIFAADYGIRITRPIFAKVSDCQVLSMTGTTATTGIALGVTSVALTSEGSSMIERCYVTGFQQAVTINGTQVNVNGCTLADCIVGIQQGTSGGLCQITDTEIDLHSTAGLSGILLAASGTTVRNCRIENPRVAWVAEVPVGIVVPNGVDNVTLSQNRIVGFFNSATPGGYGIVFQGTSADSLIDGCTIDTTDIGVAAVGATGRLRVTNCDINEVRIALSMQGNTVIGNNGIRLSSQRAMIGIDLYGSNVQIANCRIQNPRAAGSYLIGDNPYGIQLNAVDKVAITNVDISGFYNSVGNLGYCIVGNGATNNISIEGGVLDGALTGISLTAGTGFRIAGTAILDTETGILLQGTRNTISGCNINVSTTRGITGIDVEGADTVITGCQVICPRAGGSFTAETPVGINITALYAKVSNCLIRGWRNSFGSLGYGIVLGVGAGRATLSANTVETCWNGIHAPAASAADNAIIADNEVRSIDLDGILINNANNAKIANNLLDAAGTANAIYVANCVDVEVIGNKVFGNSVTDSGITLTGADNGTDRLRRFVVSNNNIREVTGLGIYLVGYVQNGVVHGNQVDCFLPGAPSDPTAVACIKTECTIAGDLPKNFTISGNECARAKNGIVAYGLDINNPITGLVISGNVIHHCAEGSAGTTASRGVDLFWVSDVSVEGNNISKIGLLINNADVESAPTAGANVWPEGISARSSSRLRISNNGMSDITRAGAGISNGITVLNRDTGAPFNARSIVINGNRITTTDAATTLSQGIQVISGQGVSATGDSTQILGLNIEGNTIRRVLWEGILVFAAGGSTISQVVITGNSISQTNDASFGHAIWLGTSASVAFGGGILQEVTVADNNIGNAAASGIFCSNDDDCILRTLTVRDNVIADSALRGIDIYANLTPQVFQNFNVVGNTISHSGSDEVIRVRCIDVDLQDVTVSGNTITGANAAATASVPNIQVLAEVDAVTDVLLTNVVVCDNKILGDGLGYGVELRVEGILTNLVLTGNHINLDTAGTSQALYIECNPPAPLGSEKFAGNWMVSTNQFIGGFGVFYNIANGPKLYNTTFSNNMVVKSGDNGLKLEIVDAIFGSFGAVENFTVDGNTFEFGGIVGSEGAVRLWFGDNLTAIDAVASVKVTNNRCAFINNTNGNVSRAIYVRYNAVCLGLDISGNTLDACGNVGSAATEGIIQVDLGAAAGGLASRNVSICRNKLLNNIGGFGIFCQKYSAADEAAIRGLKIEDNEIAGITPVGLLAFSADAIRVDLTGFVADFAAINPGDISIARNSIQRISSGAATHSDVGIVFIGPATVTLESVSISGNTVSNTGNGDSTDAAIWLDINDPIQGLKVDNNTIYNSLTGGIGVDLTGTITGGSICGNQVRTTTSEDAIVVTSTAAIVGLNASNNVVDDSGNRAIFVTTTSSIDDLRITSNVVTNNVDGAALRVQADGTVENITVDNNTISEANTLGSINRAISLENGAAAYNISISGNSIRDSGFGTAVDGKDGTIALLMGSGTDGLRNATIQNNKLVSCEGHGIILGLASGVTDADYYNVSVLGNGVRLQTNSGIRLDFTDTSGSGVRCCTVSNNDIYNVGDGSSDAAIHLLTPDADAISELSILGNVINLTEAVSTYGIKVEIQDAMYTTDISNNSYNGRGAATNPAITLEATSGKEATAMELVRVSNNSVYNPADYCYYLQVYRALREFQFTGNNGVNGTIGLRFLLGTAVGSQGTGKAIHFHHNSMRLNSSIDVFDPDADGTNMPNNGGGTSTDGWLCSYNVSGDVGTPGGWGTTGTAETFCHQWDQGENNADAVT